jgi:hypothetical protein
MTVPDGLDRHRREFTTLSRSDTRSYLIQEIGKLCRLGQPLLKQTAGKFIAAVTIA